MAGGEESRERGGHVQVASLRALPGLQYYRGEGTDDTATQSLVPGFPYELDLQVIN